MRCRHAMPFGTELSAAGARFRLWAPAARQVELDFAVRGSRAELEMSALADGWFEATVADAPAGTRYAFRIDGGLTVPDPASRFNPDDVHRPSMVVDPLAYEWRDAGWTGRPWEDAVIYELHVGAFTPAGSFAAAIERLGYLADLGVTAVELMPLADFPGRRNWGYDGVLPFASDASYGTPDELKRLIDAAHSHSLMVFLDVVYNHFGPEGNYLHAYAPQFFNPAQHTPWGAAINYDGEQSRTVRDFFIHNALYWLEEYRFDGLRLDAVDWIVDESSPDILVELASSVREGPGAGRHIHLVLENDRNEAHYLGRDGERRPLHATAQWNDDIHHAAHVVVTGEVDGYYADYAARPLWYFARCLAEGFGYQGEPSPYRGDIARGEPSVHLPPDAFVSFLQTHDQVGNRAFGERIGHIANPRALRAAVACILLAPSPPLLFMGEEFSASTPFLFFCDFGPELALAVTQGRRKQFARFARFADPALQATIPDPNTEASFERSKLVWSEAGDPGHREWSELYRECLGIREAHIAPRLRGATPSGGFEVEGEELMYVRWTLGDGSHLQLAANFSAHRSHPIVPQVGQTLYASYPIALDAGSEVLPACSVRFTLRSA
ncbi:MAG TPA: malto-oligosyltrehalose trehalohydrolase [Casimicrobiaceae bacterium]